MSRLLEAGNEGGAFVGWLVDVCFPFLLVKSSFPTVVDFFSIISFSCYNRIDLVVVSKHVFCLSVCVSFLGSPLFRASIIYKQYTSTRKKQHENTQNPPPPPPPPPLKSPTNWCSR